LEFPRGLSETAALVTIDQCFSPDWPTMEVPTGLGPNLKGPLMKSIQRLAVLGLIAFSTVSIAQQTPANPPLPQPGSQTTTTTTTTQDPGVPRHDKDSTAPAQVHDQTLDAPVPLTKKELKEQRRRQKQEEKSAKAHAEAAKHNAKAADENAKAMEQENKATNATQKASTPQ
jgi:hypothetical protein